MYHKVLMAMLNSNFSVKKDNLGRKFILSFFFFFFFFSNNYLAKDWN